MARHYSTKQCFRQMPNELLARFFHKYDLFLEFNFNAMKEAKIDALFEAWLSLPEKQRNAIDVVLQEVFELSCEKGFRAITDEAKWQMDKEPEKLKNFIRSLSDLPNHSYRAMTTFLDYSECWKGATLFYHADTLRYWRKRKHMANKHAATDKASTTQLAKLVSDYFYLMEGRGKNCIVEVLRRGELDYYFAYPEDFSQHDIEWVDGELGQRPHNPAFEIVFIYSQKEGTLDLNFHGIYKAVEHLQEMFAIAILKMNELHAAPKDNRIYDLNPIRNRNFNFIHDIGSGIENVFVKKIRLTSRSNTRKRITFEEDPFQNPYAIYDQLEQAGKSIPLHLYNVTQVELVVQIKIDMNKPTKNIPINLTYPNSCSLKYDDTGLRLRAMLKASGIEPQAVPEQTEMVETAEA